MQLTEEQQAVVDIDSGRHLVLAPPGSGKTEMLTQRVVSALRKGINPDQMFCVTFTVRAGVEMRERVQAAVSNDPNLANKAVPDIGNIHHFCNRVLLANNLITQGQRVVDDIAQKELIKDVWIQLKKELEEKASTQTLDEPVQTEFDFEEGAVQDVLRVLDYFAPHIPEGMQPRAYYADLLGKLESCVEKYNDLHRTVYSDLVSASARIHRQAAGVPYSLLLPMPHDLLELFGTGLLHAISKAYVHLKDRFGALDFDDLITNTYLALKEDRILPTANRYQWIQVDEVQDLNAIQWAIVKMVSREDATAVYFGDAEQTIFSFMGASLERLSRVATNCQVHYFKKNFRATDYLLDILVRFSIKVLRSKWLFLPEPCGTDFKSGELFLGPKRLFPMPMRPSEDCVIDLGLQWLEDGKGKNVAFLVRRNSDADMIERVIKSRGTNVKYVKVSGVEIFELGAMRDFMALCSLMADSGDGSLMVWARMFRRFGGIRQDHISRRLVKMLVDKGMTPSDFLRSDGGSLSDWARNRLQAIHDNFSGLWEWCCNCLVSQEKTYRDIFDRFEKECWEKSFFGHLDYVTPDELNQYMQENRRPGEDKGPMMPLDEARSRFKKRSEKLFDYLDKKYQVACSLNADYADKTFGDRLKLEWRSILQLREADLMTGDEKIIISTIHKAKGRQFDGVIIPCCQEGIFPSFFARDPDALDEDARVLYVGLSRAKYNLAVCWEPCLPIRPSRFLDPIRPCFQEGFRNFFRADRDPNDWLIKYNEFLEDGLRRTCNMGRVEQALSGTDMIVKRVALSTVQYAGRGEHGHTEGLLSRRRGILYSEYLLKAVRTPEECDIFKEVLKGVMALKISSFISDNSIRKAFINSTISPFKDAMRFAILNCYGSFLERPNDSLDDVLDGNVQPEITDDLRNKIKVGIADALFDSNGDVRLEAVRLLRDNFSRTSCEGFDGSDNDWFLLRSYVTDDKRRVLNWILQTYGHAMTDKVWRNHLEEVLRRHD